MNYRILFLIFVLIACANLRVEYTTPTPPLPTIIPTQTAVVIQTLPTPLPFPTPLPLPTFTPEQPLSCLLPDLAFDQHLSSNGSYEESQWSASGLMTCRIERDTCPYHHLVGLLDPTIVYRQEEEFPYSTEDILMHPSMVRPLSRLSQLVLAEWDGEASLRVTDAYDSLLEHDLNQPDLNRKYSLHFEGRAIDLTLWPVDRSRYGRLCALAICAGFDWVHHEVTHCHASIQAESLCDLCSE